MGQLVTLNWIYTEYVCTGIGLGCRAEGLMCTCVQIHVLNI